MTKLKNNNKGITLIALVITIVVLLILAAISITALVGENGLIQRAKLADKKTQEGAQNDIDAIENLGEQVNKLVNGTTEEDENNSTATIESLMKEASNKNETVYDKYGNKIVVPAGFKIVSHGTGSGNNVVEYTYDKQDGISTNTPVVQDGIVIQNAEDGNEFVWVPIGKIKNDAEANTTNTTTITLGRYSDFTMPADGSMPTPVQIASKTEYDIPALIDSYYIEISNNFAGGTFQETEYGEANSYANDKSLNLQEWINTSLDNGGYYIARFEASKNGNKAASKVTTLSSYSNPSVTYYPEDGRLWNFISRENGVTASRATYPYSEDALFYSDLINSYAWDTALIFIQTYSGDKDYANQDGKSINSSIAKAGENSDKRCNIHDLAGNAQEWTTETSTYANRPATYRGGYCSSDSYSGKNRLCNWNTTYGYAGITFRLILYTK